MKTSKSIQCNYYIDTQHRNCKNSTKKSSYCWIHASKGIPGVIKDKLFKYRIKPSLISNGGQGLFLDKTSEPIEKDTMMNLYEGTFTTKKELNKKYGKHGLADRTLCTSRKGCVNAELTDLPGSYANDCIFSKYKCNTTFTQNIGKIKEVNGVKKTIIAMKTTDTIITLRTTIVVAKRLKKTEKYYLPPNRKL